ncbi:hypothetical protein BCR44DRAFT_65476 [Catenaria anguillulae PL171]|uniref:F-box domain-containing protein n=1 Tax=Catenaria anguillulae PL171 TaxID=765915 RepID=A0A1Y2HUS4_9FUNG|nr:hypothetical protein BCR44DRAFT_65476 [Catenaria anguillulae PL171]
MSSSNNNGASRGRGRGRGGSVRGPTSALTSFLQEQGISARAIAQGHRRRQEEAAAAAAAGAASVPGTSTADANTQGSDATSTADGTQADDAMDVDGDEEDAEDDLVVAVRSTRSRSRRGAAVSSSSSSNASDQVADSSSNGIKTKRKPRKRKPDTSSDDDDDDDDFIGSGTGRNSQPQRPDSSVCIKCRRTITKFTKSAYASVCRSCAGVDANDATTAARAPLRSTRRNAATNGDAAVPALPKRRIGRARETAAEYALVRDDQDLALAQSQVPSLQDMCIKALVDLIDHVEDLGDLSAGSLRKLARVLCKKRRLDAGILPLFTGPFMTSLTLYDVTSLDAEVLGRLSFLCPKLRVLHLAFCGRANDETIDAWIGAGWDGLCEVTLKGPYLVTDGAWSRFFEAYGRQLTKLNLEHCAKLAEPGVRALVEAQAAASYPLEDLALHYADSLSSSALDHLTNFVNLQGLSLMYSCTHLTDVHVEAYTRSMPQLRAIAIGVAAHLTDKSLFALRRIQSTLAHLTLSSVDGITTAGVHSWLRGVWPPVRGRIVGEGEEEGESAQQGEQQQAQEQAQSGPAAGGAVAAGSEQTAGAVTNGTSGDAGAASGDAADGYADAMDVDGPEDEDPLYTLPTLTAEEALEWEEHDTLPSEIDFSDILAPPSHITFPTLSLETLVLDRCRGINSDAALVPILEQSAPYLKRLALNWMDQVTHRSLMALVDSVGAHPVVRDLDLSWVRCVDDPVLEQLVERLPELARVTVFGCNKLTAWATVLKQWENARGDRVAVIGSEFAEA